MRFNIRRSAISILLLSFLAAAGVHAAERMAFDLPPQALLESLRAVGQQTGTNVLASAPSIAGLKAPALRGQMTADEAFARLLAGSGLKHEFLDEKTVTFVSARPKELSSTRSGEPGVSDTAHLQLARATVDAAPAAGQVQDGTADAREAAAARADTVTPAADGDDSEQRLVVTGSRIATTPSQVAANVVTLSAEDLRTTGQSTLEGALRQLPQNILGASEVGAAVVAGGMSFNGALNVTGGSSINLRGLGSESSLVLIDGRRIGKSGSFGGVSDVSGIPLSSVERVEIMLDGASAIYGSDAVGGVVNIILKKNYRGMEADYEYGTPQEGGFDEHLLTLSGGNSWENGRIRATFEHMQRSNLDGADRPGRASVSNFYQSPASVGGFPLFYTYNGQNYLPSELAGAGLTASSPGVTRINYAILPDNQDGSSLTVDDFLGISTNSRDAYVDIGAGGVSLIPKQERSTAQFGFDRDFFDGNLTLSGNAYYSDRQTSAGSGVFVFTGRLAPGQGGNIFEGTTSQYWIIDSMPNRRYETDQQVLRWNFGANGNIGERWRWNSAVGRSRDEFTTMYYNGAISSFNSPTFNALVDQGLNMWAGDIAQANSQALLDQLIIDPFDAFAINEETSAELSFSGSLFSIAGGDVHMAVGADWREETLESGSSTRVTETTGDLTGTLGSLPPGAYADSTAKRELHAFFAEVLVPLVGRDNAFSGVHRLALTGAARYDSYKVYGSDNTWSLGMVWSPLEQLTVKVNKATSFVAPTPRDGLATTIVFSYGPGGYDYPVIVDETGALTGETVPLAGTIRGGNPDLVPETASSLSAGIEFTPDAVPGLQLSAVYHQTDYTNRIGPAPAIHWLTGTDFAAVYPNLIPDGNGRLVWDLRSINSASLDVAGIDYRVQYDRDTSIGEISLAANVGHTRKYDRVIFAGQPPVSEVGEVGFQTRAVVPSYRYSANAGLYRGGLAMNLDISTASKTISTGTLASSGTVQRIGHPALQMDLLLSYDLDRGDWFTPSAWLQGTAVSLRVLNLLDDYPEYEIRDLTKNKPGIPELNTTLTDPRGRMFYVKLSKRF